VIAVLPVEIKISELFVLAMIRKDAVLVQDAVDASTATKNAFP
jgi:hypothetical protein